MAFLSKVKSTFNRHRRSSRGQSVDESSPVEIFKRAKDDNKFLAVVYYRGLWCPFCKAYLKDLTKVYNDIKAAGGQVIAVTADNQQDVDKAKSEWDIPFEIVSDPDHKLLRYLRENKIFTVVIQGKNGDDNYNTEADRTNKYFVKYENGVAQPGLLFITKEGNKLFDWHIVPAEMNYGGATDRPVVAEVWAAVQKVLRGELKAEDVKPESLTPIKFEDVLGKQTA